MPLVHICCDVQPPAGLGTTLPALGSVAGVPNTVEWNGMEQKNKLFQLEGTSNDHLV